MSVLHPPVPRHRHKENLEGESISRGLGKHTCQGCRAAVASGTSGSADHYVEHLLGTHGSVRSTVEKNRYHSWSASTWSVSILGKWQAKGKGCVE